MHLDPELAAALPALPDLHIARPARRSRPDARARRPWRRARRARGHGRRRRGAGPGRGATGSAARVPPASGRGERAGTVAAPRRRVRDGRPGRHDCPGDLPVCSAGCRGRGGRLPARPGAPLPGRVAGLPGRAALDRAAGDRTRGGPRTDRGLRDERGRGVGCRAHPHGPGPGRAIAVLPGARCPRGRRSLDHPVHAHFRRHPAVEPSGR